MVFCYLAAASLAEWISTRSTGFEKDLRLTAALGVVTRRDFEAGDTIFELKHESILTPAAAFADRECGRDLQSYADRIGPGFDTVALAAFIAIERVRGFQAAQWYAGTSGAERDSQWSPVTSNLWALEMKRPSTISDPELQRAVVQGMELVLPMVELAARRATDFATNGQEEGWSRADVMLVLEKAFALVVRRQVASPPPPLGGDEGEPPFERWGFEDSAPEGPALLPPLAGVLLLDANKEEGDAQKVQGNAAIGLPPRPRFGSLGAGVGLRCVATRRIDAGTRLWRALDE